MTSSNTRPRRGPGRPRSGESGGQGSSREQIIRTATALFAENGFANTTITEIATAAGLQQSSFYYYFKSKEEILHATLALNRQALAVADDLRESEESASVKLFKLLQYDTLQLCMSPFDFNEIERAAQVQVKDFSEFWRDYGALHSFVASLISSGVDDGEFAPCDVLMSASAALCLNEGLQKRFHQQQLHAGQSNEHFTLDVRSAEDFALTSASITLTSLLVDRSRLTRLRERAERT